MIDVNILLTQLNNTGLQNKNTPLYQFLKSLIDSLKSTQTDVSSISAPATPVINNITQNIIGVQGQDGNDAEDRVIMIGSTISPFVENETPGGSVNSSNTVFTTANNYQPGQLLLYLNGVRQKITIDYTETSSNSFTFVVAPTTGDILLVDYGVLSSALVGPQGIQGPTGPQGIAGTGSYPQDGIDAEYYQIPGPPGPALVAAAAKVYRSSNQTISNSVETAISLNTEVYDTNTFWVIASPTLFTIPVGYGGKYIVVGQVKWSISGSGAGYIRIYQNGTLVGESYTQLVDTNSTLNVACQVSVVPGDTLEMRVFQSCGSNETVIGGTGTYFALEIAAGNGEATASVPSGLVLLAEQTASSSAELDFISRNVPGQSGAIIQSDFDDYQIEVINIILSVNNIAFGLQASTNGGSTYDSGANYSSSIRLDAATFNTVLGSNLSATAWFVLINVANTTAQDSINVIIRMMAPGNSSLYKPILAQGTFRNNDGNYYSTIGSGFYRITTAVNAFRFVPSSGNIVSGTVRVYGLSK